MTQEADELARDFAKGTPTARLVQRVRESPAPASLLEKLGRSGDSEVRAWVVHAIHELVGNGLDVQDASRVLYEMATRERDADTRDLATRLVAQLDPRKAQQLIPALVRRLRSDDYYAPIRAAWTLAEIRGGDRSDDVIAYADRVGTDRWQGRQAEIVAALMREDDGWLSDRITAHDHDMMHALCRAAAMADAASLDSALQHCVSTFDEECAAFCRNAIETRSASRDAD